MNINKELAFDFDKICRVCCTISDEAMMPVFKMNFHKKIMTCTQVKVWQNDGLPNKICKKCIAKLHIAYQFKKLCENSDIQLRVYKRRCIDECNSDSESEDIDVDDNKIDVEQTSLIDNDPPVEESGVDVTTLNVPQDFTYQDCLPLTDTRHYETLQGINISTGDISYDPHMIFGGSTMMPAIAPINLTSQGQLPMAGNYNIQSINPSATYQSNFSISSLTHNTRVISPSQMLNIDNLTDQSNEVSHRTIADDYIQQVVEIPATSEEFKPEKKSPAKLSRKEARRLFYKKCEEENRCPICNKTFGASGKLSRHMKTHGEKSFKCKTCKKSFSHMGNYRVHLRIHNDEWPFRCHVCQRGCRQQQDLDKHLRTHTGEKPHQCNICQRSFSTSSNLVVHKRIHSGEKPYVCCVCHKTFCQSNELSKHMRVHTGEKSHTCTICGRGFNGASTLSVHMRVHTGLKPYACHICEKGFSQSSGLAVHLRIHISQADLQCSLCPESFSTHGELEQHIMTHNPRELSCTYAGCSKKFTRPQNLARHIKIHEARKLANAMTFPQSTVEDSKILI